MRKTARIRNETRGTRPRQQKGKGKCQEVEQRDPQGGVEDVVDTGDDGVDDDDEY
jgi:hypothetical protein